MTRFDSRGVNLIKEFKTLTTSESVSQYTGNKFDECVELCKKTEFRHDSHGSMSKGTGTQQFWYASIEMPIWWRRARMSVSWR